MEFQLKPYVGLWSIWTMNETYKTRHLQYMCYLYSSNDEGAQPFARLLFNDLSLSLSRSHVHHSHSIFRVLLWKYSHIILCDSSIEYVFIPEKKCFFVREFFTALWSQNWIFLFSCCLSLCVLFFPVVLFSLGHFFSSSLKSVGYSLGGETQITQVHLKTKQIRFLSLLLSVKN